MKKHLRYLLFLFFVGGFLHFFHLGSPRSVVFDEVHFGKFVSAYCCTKANFFDLHPPHAKLLIAGLVKVFSSYDGSFGFNTIGDEYPADVPIEVLRFLPALLGTLLPLLIYGLLVVWGVSPAVSFLGAAGLVLENALLIQTRIVVLDGFLVFFVFLALCLFYTTKKYATTPAKLRLGLCATGIAAGFAVGTKLIALPIILLLAGLALAPFLRQKTLKSLKHSLEAAFLILTSAAITYLIGFVLSFWVLSEPGYGDQYYLRSGRFWTDFVNLHEVMIDRNASLTAPHWRASPWWSWPVMHFPVYYWAGDGQRGIYFIGNPVMWWGSLLFFVGFIGGWIRDKFTGVFSQAKTSGATQEALVLTSAGWALTYLPFSFFHRPLFLYHYLTPLIFGWLFICVEIDRRQWFSRTKRLSDQRNLYWAWLGALTLGFIVMMPLTYGWPKDGPLGQFIFWMIPGWR